jgi:diguanylate cyclase (GGDEF)-like protein
MPSPGASSAPRLPVEDAYLELLADTLEQMDTSARSQFLQRYFQTTTHLDLRESQCLQMWEEMLVRRKEMSERVGRAISLKTVLMDVLSSAGLVRVPVVLEYEQFKKLQTSAVTDPLTGLYNRRLFSESFEKELNRARRYGLPLSIVMLDLHRFKEVNDKYGHPRGDEVLRAVAKTLQKALRTSDSAFRIGGDEFVLLLPQTDAAQALALSRRVETVFAETLETLQLAISVAMDHGVGTYPQDGEQTHELIRVADERLYHLKHANQSSAAMSAGRPAGAAAAVETPAGNDPISITAARAAEKHPTGFEAATSVAAQSIVSQAAAQPPAAAVYTVQRKAERVSMTGTNAYAVLGENASRRARVLDLGFGGVALELEKAEELQANVVAVLHVPILPPVRVFLRPVWSRQTTEGTYRLGCQFVS